MNNRCWGLTKNLNRCGRYGDWTYFCEQHTKQPLVWLLFFVFTICAGSASIYGLFKPVASRQDVEEIVAQYIGEKPKNPPAKEVKSEIEKELKAAFEKQEKKALELYELGDSAYDNNQFKEAITHFKAALEIVKTPSIYFSLGNSLLVTSDFTSAKAAYQTALELFRKKKDKNGEGNSLGNLGLAYRALGQVEKAIEYYKQALAISRARKTCGSNSLVPTENGTLLTN